MNGEFQMSYDFIKSSRLDSKAQEKLSWSVSTVLSCTDTTHLHQLTIIFIISVLFVCALFIQVNIMKYQAIKLTK